MFTRLDGEEGCASGVRALVRGGGRPGAIRDYLAFAGWRDAMTRKQLREYKQANQERKAQMIQRIKALPKRDPDKAYYARFGLIQDGRFTK